MIKIVDIDVEIRFSDCDCNGNVYFSKYFVYFEKGRFEIARRANLLNDETGKDIYFPVVEASCTYKKPIHMSDNVIMRSILEKPVISRLVFIHKLINKDSLEEYASAKVVVAIVSRSKGLLIKLDENMKRKIYQYILEKRDIDDSIYVSRTGHTTTRND